MIGFFTPPDATSIFPSCRDIDIHVDIDIDIDIDVCVNPRKIRYRFLVRRRIHALSYEEEDTCMSYEEDTCMLYEEEHACMTYDQEDTCIVICGGGYMHVI